MEIVFRSCIPFLEKATMRIIGKGISMANAGRGGNLLKSEKKPLPERIVNIPIQITSINTVPKNILFWMFFPQFVLFNTALNPVKIIAMQASVSNSHKKSEVEKLLFIV